MILSLLKQRRKKKNKNVTITLLLFSESNASCTTALGFSAKKKMRIADILQQPEEATSYCTAAAISTSSGGRTWVLPSTVFRGEGKCWVRFLKRRGWRERKKEEEEEEEKRKGEMGDPSSSSSSGSMVLAVAEEAEVVPMPSKREEEEDWNLEERKGGSGRKPEEVSFNSGVGVGFILLLAKSATELKKLLELRAEMETLLKEFKDAMPRKAAVSNSAESKDDPAFTCSESCGEGNLSNHFSGQNRISSFHFLDNHVPMECIGNSNCEKNFENNEHPKIDQLEAELESELELLQINLEKDNSSEHSGRELECELEMIGENSDLSENSTANFEEEIYAKQEDVEEEDRYCNGVPPHELERRLHQLLQKRQEERIEELESALQCAERKLLEKEMEICWWKDTARLLSQHKQEVVRR